MARVQTADAQSTSAVASQAATFGSSTASGNLIVVQITTFGGGVTGITVTDNKGNTYNAVAGGAAANGANKVWWAYAENISGGATHTVTAACQGVATAFISIGIIEYSGMATSGSLNSAGVASATGTSTTPSAGIVTVTSGDVLIAGACNGTVTTWTVGTGFTSVINKNNANVYEVLETEDWTSDGSAKDAGFTMSASLAWAAGCVAFKAAGGGGGGKIPPSLFLQDVA